MNKLMILLLGASLMGCATTSQYEGLKAGITEEKERVCSTSCVRIANVGMGRTIAEDNARHDLFKYLTNAGTKYSGTLFSSRVEEYSEADGTICTKVCTLDKAVR